MLCLKDARSSGTSAHIRKHAEQCVASGNGLGRTVLMPPAPAPEFAIWNQLRSYLIASLYMEEEWGLPYLLKNSCGWALDEVSRWAAEAKDQVVWGVALRQIRSGSLWQFSGGHKLSTHVRKQLLFVHAKKMSSFNGHFLLLAVFVQHPVSHGAVGFLLSLSLCLFSKVINNSGRFGISLLGFFTLARLTASGLFTCNALMPR